MAKIIKSNLSVFVNLAQAYEAEFSFITGKLPDRFGLYSIDAFPNSFYTGYLFYNKGIPIGFCVADIKSEVKDIAEFYIIPTMRKQGFGLILAESIFNKYPGKWQVRQIEGANNAKHFWRAVIGKITQNKYEEEVIEDRHWGIVTRQQFYISS